MAQDDPWHFGAQKGAPGLDAESECYSTSISFPPADRTSLVERKKVEPIGEKKREKRKGKHYMRGSAYENMLVRTAALPWPLPPASLHEGGPSEFSFRAEEEVAWVPSLPPSLLSPLPPSSFSLSSLAPTHLSRILNSEAGVRGESSRETVGGWDGRRREETRENDRWKEGRRKRGDAKERGINK